MQPKEYLDKKGPLFGADAVGGAAAVLAYGWLLFEVPFLASGAGLVGLAGYGLYRLSRIERPIKKPAVKAEAQATPTVTAPPKEPTREDLAAQARKDHDTAIRIANLHTDEATKGAAVATAEAKFRQRMGEILGS